MENCTKKVRFEADGIRIFIEIYNNILNADQNEKFSTGDKFSTHN